MDDFSGKIIIEWPFRDGKEWGIWKKFSILCGSKLWQNSIGNESKLTTLKCNQAFEHNMKTLEIPVCCQLGAKLPILNITWHIYYCKLMENECCSFACFCGFHIFENYITWMLMTLVDQLCKRNSPMQFVYRQGTWYGIFYLTALIHFLNLNLIFALLLIYRFLGDFVT